MGTGLGGESYAIIGQERIGQLLSAKPQDRRSIIEEAAGITRFKTKKRLAELRLESAKLNLSRVNDIFDEVAKQMGTLKRQAAKAERYGELRDELRTRLRVVLASRLTQLDTDNTATTAQIATLTTTLDTHVASTETLDAEHTAGVRHGYTLDGQIRDHAATANQSAVELERIAARTHANTDRVAELSARLASGAAELEGARAQLATLAGEQESHRAFLDSAVAESTGSRDAANRQAQLAQDAVRKVQSHEQQAENARRAGMQILQRVAQVRNEEGQATAALQGLEQESVRLIHESTTAREELQTLGLQRGQVKLSFESVQDKLKRLELELADLRLQVETRRAEESQSKRKGDQLRGEVASLNGRRSSLEGLIRDHAYSTDTVKTILNKFKKQSQSIATLADFLSVDDTHGQLVDEFLRDELNYLVVPTQAAAEEGIRLLKADVTGRATFLIATSVGAPSQSASSIEVGLLPPTEGLTPLSQALRILNPEATSDFSATILALLPKLRHGYITATPEQARTLALDHPQAWFLSPTGETHHGPTVTGGRPASSGPLALKHQLKDLESKLTTLQQDLTNTDHRTAQLQAELQTHTTQIDAKNHERRDAERESANSGAALRQMENEVQRLDRRLQDWTLSTDRNRDARNGKADLIAARQKQAEELEAERTALELTLAGLNQQVENLRLEREHLQAAAAQSAAALAGLEERRRNAQANYDQTTRLLGSQQARIGQLDQQLIAAAGERQRREEESATLATQHVDLAETRATAVAQGARLTAEAKDLREITTELDAKLRTLRAETEALRDGRATHAAHLAKLTSDLEHLEQTCLNDLALHAQDLRADASIQRIEGPALLEGETESRALKQKLEAMGPVNMMALEEFAEASQRHTFLETQRKDLLDSIENTQSAIKEIDDVSRVKFDEAYKVINENFSLTFTKLFGGGQAFMRLTDPDNPNSGLLRHRNRSLPPRQKTPEHPPPLRWRKSPHRPVAPRRHLPVPARTLLHPR